jgi:hypothetical protein
VDDLDLERPGGGRRIVPTRPGGRGVVGVVAAAGEDQEGDDEGGEEGGEEAAHGGWDGDGTDAGSPDDGGWDTP